LSAPVRSDLRTRPGSAAAGRPRRARQGCERADRTRQADPFRNRLGAAGRRSHRRATDHQQPPVQVELGTFLSARDLGGAIPDLARRAVAAAGRRRFRRIPAARHRADGRGLQAQPAHRAEAEGAVVTMRQRSGSMKLADFAKGAATFLVAIAAGFLSTSYVDRYFGEPKLSKWATSGPSACVSADGSWKNWP